MARIKGLYLVLNHVPQKLQKIENRIGDCVSRRIALKVLDDVSVDFDHQAKKAKRDVEMLYSRGLSARNRAALALKLGITGGAFFGDNVGKVGNVS